MELTQITLVMSSCPQYQVTPSFFPFSLFILLPLPSLSITRFPLFGRLSSPLPLSLFSPLPPSLFSSHLLSLLTLLTSLLTFSTSPPSPPIALFLSPPSLFQHFCNLYLHSLHLLPLPPLVAANRTSCPPGHGISYTDLVRLA